MTSSASVILEAAGHRLRLETDREARPWTTVLQEFACLVRPDDGRPVEATIRLLPRGWEEPSPLTLPPNARLLRGGGRKVFASDEADVFFLDFHETAFFRVEPGRATGVCYDDDRVDPMFWTELCVNHIIFLQLRRLGLFPLHAGGAVRPDGAAVLLTGDSGAGKTTAALRLAVSGWPWLGDDLVLWERDGSVHALAKTPAATPWTTTRLGLENRVRGERRTGKRLLAPWPAGPSCHEARLYLVRASDSGHNALEPIESDLADAVLETQTSFCATDALTGAPTPSLDFFRDRLRILKVGDLDTLPEFLAAQP